MAENRSHDTVRPIIFNAVIAILNRELNFEAVNKLRAVYNPAAVNSEEPSMFDFNNDDNRQAYLYMYFTALTRAVEHFLHEINLKNPLFDTKMILNICSIGGGPGTEIFGLKLFLMSQLPHISIEGTILEYYTNWEQTYNELLEILDFEDVDVAYTEFDFRAEMDENCRQAIAQADLITLVKVVSGLSYLQDCVDKLTTLVLAMKPGAVVLFIDNSGGDYFQMMEDAARRANMTCIAEYKYEDKSYIPIEERREMSGLCVPVKPQQNLKVSVSAWEKK